MIVAFTSVCLVSSLLLLVSYAISLRPANLTARLTAGTSVNKYHWNFSTLFRNKFSEALAISKGSERVLFELPDFLELIAVAIASGDSIYAALRRVVPRLGGILGREFAFTLQAIELGGDLETELVDLCKRLPNRQLSEFCSKLNLAMRRGTPLARVLAEQAEAVRQEILNHQTKQAG